MEDVIGYVFDDSYRASLVFQGGSSQESPVMPAACVKYTRNGLRFHSEPAVVQSRCCGKPAVSLLFEAFWVAGVDFEYGFQPDLNEAC